MFSCKVNQKIIIFVILYSFLALIMHFVAIKLICNVVGILLGEIDIVNVSNSALIKNEADKIRRYSEIISSVFILMCYFFIALIGILLVAKKINLLNYFMDIILFSFIQGPGIYILTRFINLYEMDVFGRLGVVIHQNITTILIVIPVFCNIIQKLYKKCH